MNSLYIVIPAYNEESNIDKVIREWHEVVAKIGGNSKPQCLENTVVHS